jgi:hypothetical protein
MMNKQTALSIVGGLSEPSKMPCYSFSIPAQKCITGMKLRDVDGSICNKCYALRGNYLYSNVKNALARRFEGLSNPQWVEAMAFLINTTEASGFFRWHDSGDIQSVAHLDRIIQVCKLTPEVKHWLPTREYSFISQWRAANGAFPSNLTIRLSALMMEAQPPTAIAKRLGVATSGVSKVGFTCPSSIQGNKCIRCRACWDSNVENVNYKRH